MREKLGSLPEPADAHHRARIAVGFRPTNGQETTPAPAAWQMKSFPHTSTFLRAVKRIVQFKPAAEALDNPIEPLAYAMTHSTDRYMALLLDHAGEAGLREAIDKAPAGIIDARSWSQWNARIGRIPAPPPPRRKPA
jgi:hypothetical protein